jgi:hypothetical protein
MTTFRFTSLLVTALLSLFWTTVTIAEKTDVVVLINGDEVTGEVKGLDFGALSYSTDSMGTVNIDWEDIVSLTSNQTLQVEVSTGARFFGTLITASDNQHIAVVRAGGIEELNKSTVVRMTPIDVDDSFLDRLEGSVSFGFNTGKASGVSQGNLNASVRYRARDYLVGITTNSTITDQPGQDTTRRASVTLNYQRFRANRWYTDWFSTYETNEELGIQNRVSLGGGVGRFFVQTNKNQFSILAGLVATRETFTGDDQGETNAEGKIAIRYLRRVLAPSTDLAFTSNIYPLLEDFSQFRAETDMTLRREIIEDLFLDLSFYHSYTSNPPTDAEKEDYGVITSIGYSF